MANLLIVDDDPDFATSVAAVCEGLGHQASMVHSTKLALEHMAKSRPDGVLLDVIFPEDPGAGFQLAREIRRQFGAIPILMLTAVNQQFPLGFSDKDIDSKWLPVTDFLEKPVDFDVLKEKITQLCRDDKEAHAG